MLLGKQVVKEDGSPAIEDVQKRVPCLRCGTSWLKFPAQPSVASNPSHHSHVCLPQGQVGEAHGKDSGQCREVLGPFCTLTASYTQKVANLCSEVDLLVKQLADYADTESLVP